MKNIIIGLILKTLTKEYNSGACDNLSEEEQLAMLVLLTELRSYITDKLLTTEEACKELNISRQTLHKYVKEGKIHPKKLLGGVLQYSKRELNSLK